MILSLIAAVSENGVIGTGDDMPWHLPADLKYFKRTTVGHPIVIGRKTFESFGSRPLPNRRNLILTRDVEFRADGAEVYGSLEDALAACEGESEVFISGGAQIYEIAFPMCTRLYLTEIHASIDGKIHFPDYDKNQWEMVSEKFFEKDEKNSYSMTWKVFQRV